MNQESHPLLYSRFNVLNGMRGIALFWVMFVHLPGFSVPEFLRTPHDHWKLGVDFFLAISGFLVTRSLFQSFLKRDGSTLPLGVAVREYLIRRVARIIPPYLFALALFGAIAMATRNNFYDALVEIAPALPAFPLLFANYMIAVYHEQMPGLLKILWSVSFQEQFYFLLGLLFFLGRLHVRWLLLGLACFSIFARLYLNFGPWAELAREDHYVFWLHLNFDSLAWGCLAWIYYDQLGALFSTPKRRQWSLTLILLADIVAVAGGTLFGSKTGQASDLTHILLQTLKAPAFALSVRALCELEKRIENPFSRLLQNKWLMEIGTVSYEVYLLHLLLYGIIEKAWLKVGLELGPAYILAVYPVSIAVGMVFYNTFGKPSQEWSKKILRRALSVKEPMSKLQSAMSINTSQKNVTLPEA